MYNKEESPERCNCARIRRAARNITRYYDTTLAPSGLGAGQFTLLGCLLNYGAMRMVQLAELLAMDRATIGHNLRPLERDGLIEMTIDKDDRRARQITITPAGLARLKGAVPLWTEAQEHFESRFGVPEAEAMRGVMDIVGDMPLLAKAA